jgi:hypothetical protein
MAPVDHKDAGEGEGSRLVPEAIRLENITAKVVD